MAAEATNRVLNYVFADLRPGLPDGAGIRVTTRGRRTTVQRADEGSLDFHGIQYKVERDDQGRPTGGSHSGVTVGKLAPSAPWIPRSARRQIAAKSALDTLLEIFYPAPFAPGFHKSTDYRILSEDRPTGVVLSYQLPGSDTRVELRTLPHELFD